MSSDKRKNSNDLTTGDRLYDSGLRTDGALPRDEPKTSAPEAQPIESNFSTYAGNALAEARDNPDPVGLQPDKSAEGLKESTPTSKP